MWTYQNLSVAHARWWYFFGWILIKVTYLQNNEMFKCNGKTMFLKGGHQVIYFMWKTSLMNMEISVRSLQQLSCILNDKTNWLCKYKVMKWKKKEIWLSPMTKPPIPTENLKTKGQHTHATKNFDFTTIADPGWSVGVTSHPTGVVKPLYGYPTFPLTTKAVWS